MQGGLSSMRPVSPEAVRVALCFPGTTHKPETCQNRRLGKPLLEDESLLGWERLGDMPVSLSKSTKRVVGAANVAQLTE